MSGKVGSITTSIIVDGLVINMDAANRASYPKTGTTWVDTINNNNGTLTNGPVFDSANGGSIDFDGTDQMVNIGEISVLDIERTDTKSVFSFCYPEDTSVNGLSGKAKSGGVFKGWSLRFSSGKIQIFIANSTSNRIYIESTSTYSINNWYYVGFSYDGSSNANGVTMYINGVSVPFTIVSNSLTSTTIQSGAPFQIGTSRENLNYFNGNIANAQVYNRELSATEILQNYNALKGRFGL